jgi:hypothetical protein
MRDPGRPSALFGFRVRGGGGERERERERERAVSTADRMRRGGRREPRCDFSG